MIPKSDLLGLISEPLLAELQNVEFFPSRASLISAQDRYMFSHGWVGAINDLKISEKIVNELLKRNVTYENYLKYGDLKDPGL